jgi:RNA-directed DNA polymerase
MPKAQQKLMMEWNDIPWKLLQRKVFKMQKRIYRAASCGDRVKTHGLQRILLSSWYAKLLAVRQVTQLNQGKKGVKSISPSQGLRLARNLRIKGKAKSVRRVFLPKPGKADATPRLEKAQGNAHQAAEKRPLGIPTLEDRAVQALVKMAMEPEWEAKFEPTSYGFRPARSAHDAVARIYTVITNKSNYVLDADISKCFDQIDHKYLLDKLRTIKPVRKQVKAWLRAGVMKGEILDKVERGTPPGDVISPLLANIALDGMARHIEKMFPKKGNNPSPRLIRYADKFVILHPELAQVLKAKEAIQEWLKPVGLELKPEKTRICHTLNQRIMEDGKTETPGFDFLGFNIRQYPVGRHRGLKNILLGFKTIIKPSKKSILAHHNALKEIVKKHRTTPQAALIGKLNPIIRGWSNYYSGVTAKETFSSEDSIIWQMLRAWTRNRCGLANFKKLSKYFRIGKHGKWTFCTQDGLTLWKHADIEIKRHTLVLPDKSPYDGDWFYWSTRRGKEIETPTRVAK